MSLRRSVSAKFRRHSYPSRAVAGVGNAVVGLSCLSVCLFVWCDVDVLFIVGYLEIEYTNRHYSSFRTRNFSECSLSPSNLRSNVGWVENSGYFQPSTSIAYKKWLASRSSSASRQHFTNLWQKKKFSMTIDDASHCLFVLLYLKTKTKHLNKKYFNTNYFKTSLLPVNISLQCWPVNCWPLTVCICQRHVTRFGIIACRCFALK